MSGARSVPHRAHTAVSRHAARQVGQRDSNDERGMMNDERPIGLAGSGFFDIEQEVGQLGGGRLELRPGLRSQRLLNLSV